MLTPNRHTFRSMRHTWGKFALTAAAVAVAVLLHIATTHKPPVETAICDLIAVAVFVSPVAIVMGIWWSALHRLGEG